MFDSLPSPAHADGPECEHRRMLRSKGINKTWRLWWTFWWWSPHFKCVISIFKFGIVPMKSSNEPVWERESHHLPYRESNLVPLPAPEFLNPVFWVQTPLVKAMWTVAIQNSLFELCSLKDCKTGIRKPFTSGVVKMAAKLLPLNFCCFLN